MPTSGDSSLPQGTPLPVGERALSYLFFAFAALFLVYNHLQMAVSYFIWDDAFISYRYARNWAEGHGLVYNVGEHVEGYSNFLWICLLALGEVFGIHPVPASYTLGVLCGLISLLAVFAIARDWLGDGLFAVVPCVFVAINAAYNRWAVSGLETPLYNMLLILGIYFWTRERRSPSPPWGTLTSFSLLALTRPEGIALGWVFILADGVLSRVFTGSPARIRGCLPVLGSVTGVFLLHTLWRLFYYGSPLPNSFYIKVGFTFHQVLRGWEYLQEAHSSIQVVFLVPFALFFLVRKRHPVAMAIGVLILFQSVYLVAIGGDWMGLRLYTCLIPLWGLLAGGGFAAFSELLRERRVSPVSAACLTVTLLGAYLWIIVSDYPRSFKNPRNITVAPYWTERKQSADFAMKLAADRDLSQTRLSTSFGEVAYYYRGPVLDPSGLNDPHISRRPRPEGSKPLGEGVAGHERFDFNFILMQEPELIYSDRIGLDLGWRQPLYRVHRVPETRTKTLYERIEAGDPPPLGPE